MTFRQPHYELLTEPWPHSCSEFLQYVAFLNYLYVLPLVITPTNFIWKDTLLIFFSNTTCFWIWSVGNKLTLASGVQSFCITQKERMCIGNIFKKEKDIVQIMLTSIKGRNFWPRSECWICLNTVTFGKLKQPLSLSYDFWKSDTGILEFCTEW